MISNLRGVPISSQESCLVQEMLYSLTGLIDLFLSLVINSICLSTDYHSLILRTMLVCLAKRLFSWQNAVTNDFFKSQGNATSHIQPVRANDGNITFKLDENIGECIVFLDVFLGCESFLWPTSSHTPHASLPFSFFLEGQDRGDLSGCVFLDGLHL